MGGPILFESKSCGATRVYRARPWGPAKMPQPESSQQTMKMTPAFPGDIPGLQSFTVTSGILHGIHDPIHVSSLHDMHLKLWDLASSLMIWCIKFTVAHHMHPWITCSWSNAPPHHSSLICGQIDRKHSQRTQRISCWKGGNNLKPFQERTGRCN